MDKIQVIEDLRERIKIGQQAGLPDIQLLMTEIELLYLHVDKIEKALKESK